jgi:hypothetical protein
MIVSFRYRRFVEYWPPFAVLFAAFSLQAVSGTLKNAAVQLPSNVMEELLPFLDRHEPPGVEQQRRERHWLESETALVGFALGLVAYAPVYLVEEFRKLPPLVQPQRSGRLMIEVGAAVIILVACLAGYFFWRKWAKALAVLGITALSCILLANIHETSKSIAEDHAPEYYAGGMEWIKENVKPGELIFNTDWDDFPKLFYLDTTHSYTSGLDPTYLLDQNAELSKLYVDITLGKEKDPGPLIRDRFGTRYVFSDNEEVHDNFYAAAMDSGWFDKVYEDEECTVLRIRDQKGEPPPEAADGAGPDEPDDQSPGESDEEPPPEVPH